MGQQKRALVGAPCVFVVELGRGTSSKQPASSSYSSLQKIAAEAGTDAAVATAAAAATSAYNSVVLIRPDLVSSSSIMHLEGVPYQLAWLTFCNGMHHWAIVHRSGGRSATGWHHYDNMSNGGRSRNMGGQLQVLENGGFINTMGFVRVQ